MMDTTKNLMSAPIKKFPQNTLGRDFYITDPHGHFGDVLEALKIVEFQEGKDRIFFGGDLIDRGPQSYELIKAFGGHSILGNHEQMIFDDYVKTNFREFLSEQQLHDLIMLWDTCSSMLDLRNGHEWWFCLPDNKKLEVLKIIAAMPHVIEIETKKGIVGLVHAGCPYNSWDYFKKVISGNDLTSLAARDSSKWSYDRYNGDISGSVDGVFRIYSGHIINNPTNAPHCADNHYFLDSGIHKGRYLRNPNGGALTIIRIDCEKSDFNRPRFYSDRYIKVIGHF